jgi:pimeloyl-ACP methyl ester carboxylesterase
VSARADRVLGAVLFSPAGAPMSAEELATLREAFKMDGHADAVRFVRRLHGRPVGVRAHLLAPLLRRTLRDPVLRSWLDRVSEGDFLAPSELTEVSRPIRVIWGRQERILPPGAVGFWREHLPGHCEVIEPDGFGHSPFLDDRRWTADQVASFAHGLVEPACSS